MITLRYEIMYESSNGRRPAKYALSWEERNQIGFYIKGTDQISRMKEETEKAQKILERLMRRERR